MVMAAPTFAMMLQGEYYAIATSRTTLYFRATRGMHYLARLVANPGTDIHVLDLVGSIAADRGDAGELLDARAMREYRARWIELREIADDADTRGDADRAESARLEIEALARELGRSARGKRAESAVDRARSAVQRRIKDALERIGKRDPGAGSWLRRAVRTGNHCCFSPGALVAWDGLR
jgi:hypothetical protein